MIGRRPRGKIMASNILCSGNAAGAIVSIRESLPGTFGCKSSALQKSWCYPIFHPSCATVSGTKRPTSPAISSAVPAASRALLPYPYAP